MSPVVLIKRIEQELIKLRESVAQIQRLLVKVQQTGDQDYIGTIALHLHSYYNGVERILYVVAQSIDNSVPQGEDWHQQLLTQMTLAIPNIRPVLIGELAYRELNEFRGFRHVVRSNYAFELEHERVLQRIYLKRVAPSSTLMSRLPTVDWFKGATRFCQVFPSYWR